MKFLSKLGAFGLSSTPKLSIKNNEQNPSSLLFGAQEGDVFIKSTKRLNGFDSEIINQNLIKYVPSDSLRLEMQIEKTAEELGKVEKELQSNNFFMQNSEMLNKKKDFLSNTIENYRKEYRELGFSHKLTDFAVDLQKKTAENVEKVKISFTSNFLTEGAKKFIPGFKKNFEIKEKIKTLSLIQENLTTLANNKYNPFGEMDIKTEKYVQFMANANKLNFQINKLIQQNAKKNIKTFFVENFNKIKSKISEFIKEIDELNSKITDYQGYINF